LKVNAMQTIYPEVIPNSNVMTRPPTDIDTGAANYEAVRFNALKHGILSQLAVLAHEDQSEFSDLLAALLDEHRPAGMTERHLIEELATIIWRKRRVLLAEGAKINEGLKGAAGSSKSVMSSAAPFERGMANEDSDVRDLLDLSSEQVAEHQQQTVLDLAGIRKAEEILRRGGENAYAKARRALIADTREWWDENVAEESHPATAEGLAKYIREELLPIGYRMEREAR
jgi:hypothetical protein